MSVALRYYIRIFVQKQFSIDDGFLVFALCCLICALTIMYTVTVDKMYLAQALVVGLPGAQIPADFLEQVYGFHKWITVTLMLAWCAIMAVKFSFLFLFRKLIDRIPRLIVYWWVVTIFNVAVLGYGVSVYYVACPYYSNVELRKSIKCSLLRVIDSLLVQCASPAGIRKILGHSAAQTTLDLVGDLLSECSLSKEE